MPIPAYILCSRAGSIDSELESVSCYDLLEAVKFRGVARNPKPANEKEAADITKRVTRTAAKVFVVAAWIAEPADMGRDFETEIRTTFEAEGGSEKLELATASFPPVTMNVETHRLTARDMPLLPVGSPGVVTVECRIRPVGATEWAARQTYRFRVDEVERIDLPVAPQAG